MLIQMDLGLEHNLAFSWSGKISEDDMLQVLSRIRSATENGQKISLYQEIHSFDGIELDALIEKIKLLFDISIASFDKVVLVTDTKWMHRLASIEDKLFKNIAIQCFTEDKKADAMAFLQSGP